MPKGCSRERENERKEPSDIAELVLTLRARQDFAGHEARKSCTLSKGNYALARLPSRSFLIRLILDHRRSDHSLEAQASRLHSNWSGGKRQLQTFKTQLVCEGIACAASWSLNQSSQIPPLHTACSALSDLQARHPSPPDSTRRESSDSTATGGWLLAVSSRLQSCREPCPAIRGG